MDRTQNVTRNIAWGFVNKFMMIILPFLTRTVMIYFMGPMYVGLNGLFTSVLQVLNVTELGISSAIVFSMYRPLAEGKEDEVCALMNFYKQCYRVIGFVVLGVGLFLFLFIDKLISGEVPADINIYFLYGLNLFSTFITYQLFAYRSALLMAAQRNDVISKTASVTAMAQNLIQILVIILTQNYYLYAIIGMCANISNNILAAIVSKKIFPQFLCKGKISKELLNDIKIKVGGMIFQKIGGVILGSVDTIVISAFLGLEVLGIFQNYYYIISSLLGIMVVIQESLKSTVGNSIVLETKDKNYRDFKKFNYMYIWITGWCSICLLCLYQPFMQIWVGEKLMLSFDMVVLFAIYYFVHKWCDMLYIYQEACGIWWENRMVPLLAAIVNLTFNLILVNVIGLPGILISTIISVIFVYDVGYAKVLFSVYFKDGLREYTLRQLWYFISTVIVAILTYSLCSFVPLTGIWLLITRGIICIVVPNVLLWLIWKHLPEYNGVKNLLINVVSSVLSKFKGVK